MQPDEIQQWAMNRFQQQRTLYAHGVLKHLLAVREALVRHDENIKAWELMDSVAPYFVREFPEFQRALEDQKAMIEHLLDPAVYEKYYGDNPYEMPFEQQYGGQFTVETADQIPRVAWLAGRLEELGSGALLDLGCNDGWMLAHLLGKGLIGSACGGCDLAPASIERAKVRCPDTDFVVSSIENLEENVHWHNFSYVTCFEVLEHVFDPSYVLMTAWDMLSPGGHLFFSTPLGACELGWVPEWDKVEHKGHVRASLPDDVKQWCETANFNMETFAMHVDEHGLMLVEICK